MALFCPQCNTSLREPPPRFCTKCGADLTLHAPSSPRQDDKKKKMLMFGGGGALLVVLAVAIFVATRQPAEEVPEVIPQPPPAADPTEDDGFRQEFINAYNAYEGYRRKLALWYPPIYDAYADPNLAKGAQEAAKNRKLLFNALEPHLLTIKKHGGADKFRDILDSFNAILDPALASWFCEKETCPPWVADKGQATQKGDVTFACDEALMSLNPWTIDAQCTGPRNRGNLTVQHARLWKKYKGQYSRDWLDQLEADTRQNRQQGYAFANYGYLLSRLQKKEQEAFLAYTTADTVGRAGKDHENWLVSLQVADLNQKLKHYMQAQEHFARAFHNSPDHNAEVRRRVGLMALAALQNDADGQRSLAILNALRQGHVADPLLDYYEAHALARDQRYEEAITLIRKYQATLKDLVEKEKVAQDLYAFESMLKTDKRMEAIERRRAMQEQEPKPKTEDRPKGNFIRMAPPAASGSASTSPSAGSGR